MADSTLSIPLPIYQGMLEHCRKELPREACGILSGKAGVVTFGYPMTNMEASPTRYLMDPEEQFRVMREIWSRGEDLIAIYHSHPTTRAHPSETDIRLAYYSEAVYVIISMAAALPDMRAFWIVAGKVDPVQVTVARVPGQWRDLRSP